MYLIFSEQEDRQTNEIIDHLLYYGKAVQRFNDTFSEAEITTLLRVLKKPPKVAGTGVPGPPSGIAIFHRRPGRNIISQLLDRSLTAEDIEYPNFRPDSIYLKALRTNYVAHQTRFFEAVLNDPDYTICKIDYQLNKYEVLVKAEVVGLTVPPTLISGNKAEVTEFFEAHDRNIITKSLYNIIATDGAAEEGFTIKCYTQKIETIDVLPEQFFPTLFQKNIEKKYELRVFYLDGACYAAAIFSQQDPNSLQDFRNADKEHPNRIVPYQLGAELEARLVALMQAVDLNTGSIDIMVGTDGLHYFLEINPVGQYGWINTYCNFGISDAIAQKMIALHG